MNRPANKTHQLVHFPSPAGVDFSEMLAVMEPLSPVAAEPFSAWMDRELAFLERRLGSTEGSGGEPRCRAGRGD